MVGLALCFAFFAWPALVIWRDCSYISIHLSVEMSAEGYGLS